VVTFVTEGEFEKLQSLADREGFSLSGIVHCILFGYLSTSPDGE